MAAARHTSQRLTLVMLVLASITILTLDYHGEASRGITHVRNGVADGLAPVQRVVAAVLRPVGDTVSAVFHYGQLQSENQRLRTELGSVSQQLVASGYAKNAEREVQLLQSLPFAGNIPSVPAEVIADGASNFQSTFEIDRGTGSGVGVGMPVVGGAGLVGDVVAASHSTAMVQLLTDSRSVFAVQDERTGNQFQLQGNGARRPLTLSPFGTASGSVSDGAYLVTTGQTNGQPAAQYPAGIPVGRVTAVRASTGGLQSTGQVTPLVDVESLQYVAVLQWMPPA